MLTYALLARAPRNYFGPKNWLCQVFLTIRVLTPKPKLNGIASYDFTSFFKLNHCAKHEIFHK